MLRMPNIIRKFLPTTSVRGSASGLICHVKVITAQINISVKNYNTDCLTAVIVTLLMCCTFLTDNALLDVCVKNKVE
jgi:C4-dicarboxylate transporter